MPEPIVQPGNINKAYEWAIETCNAPNVGYSMDYRNQQTINGITYYDCSSFVWYALKAGGFDNIGTSPFVTFNAQNTLPQLSMQELLPAAGFTVLNAGQEKWLPGDILLGRYQAYNGVTDYQHTEMVYQGTDNVGEGYIMGAHGQYLPGQIPRPLADQVSIKTTLDYGSIDPSSTKYTLLYRFGNGASGYGLTLAQVAAMCGNAFEESTVNPGSWGQGFSVYDHGYGLWAWTDWTGEDPFYLGTEMKNWVTERYGTWLSGNGQVACVLADDLPSGSVWTNTPIPEYSYTNSQYPDMNSWINSPDKNDVEEMCLEWFLHWETPRTLGIFNDTWSDRLAFARKAYDFIREHANDTSITDWVIRTPPPNSNKYLTEAEMLNNCVMMWRFASAGGGGGGTPVKHGKMWMYLGRRRRRYD